MRKEKKEFLIGDVMERTFTIMRRLVPSEWKHLLAAAFFNLRKVPVATISCS